ncbi:MAG: dipeptide ABC transporter ATP-binding protein [Alphaproteobacteria bacterium]|nr:dipeptide ABC transporter ATP-binding protein [Alphaproteobacteria bacterium]
MQLRRALRPCDRSVRPRRPRADRAAPPAALLEPRAVTAAPAHAPLLEVRDLAKHYVARGATLRALDGVSFDLARGEVLGIVGESGCGKSTLGRTVLRLVDPTAGSIRFDGEDITALSRRDMVRRRRDMQIVFQDPFGSLNPRHRVAEIVGEPLEVHEVGDRAGRRARVAELLDLVGLASDAGGKYPHEFSGGQRQRIAIARALALEPKLLVADEPVSALDVSIQSQIINLLAELRQRLGLAMLFISHDLSVIRHVSDRIAVMYLGRIVEIGPAAALFDAPAHPYAQALLSAIPHTDPARRRERIILSGELPDPANPPPGCAFHTRCRQALPRCVGEAPLLAARRTATGTRMVACHLHDVG